jgi:hypothetical protein
MFTPNLIKIGELVPNRSRHTYRKHGDLMSLFSFVKERKAGMKWKGSSTPIPTDIHKKKKNRC